MFHKNLDDLCKCNNISITKLLQVLNLSTSKGTAWKNGSTPNGETVAKIADYFNVSTDYLLGRTDCPNMLVYDESGNTIILEAMTAPKSEKLIHGQAAAWGGKSKKPSTTGEQNKAGLEALKNVLEEQSK